MQDQKFQMQFQVEDGLQIAMDANLKGQLDQRKFKRLRREMQDLEKQRVIVWHKHFDEEMRHEMERRRQKLESLKQLNDMEYLKSVKGLEALEALKALESLKSLEVLQNIPVMNVDSIRIIVERSLREAGVDERK